MGGYILQHSHRFSGSLACRSINFRFILHPRLGFSSTCSRRDDSDPWCSSSSSFSLTIDFLSIRAWYNSTVLSVWLAHGLIHQHGSSYKQPSGSPMQCSSNQCRQNQWRSSSHRVRQSPGLLRNGFIRHFYKSPGSRRLELYNPLRIPPA